MRRATIGGFQHFVPTEISIHALHEESDPAVDCWTLTETKFQSTLSMRRATTLFERFNKIIRRFQSTLSMRRATLVVAAMIMPYISIHALHEESDFSQRKPTRPSTFQSTLSMRRATQSAQMSTDLTLFQSTLSMRRATSGTYDWTDLEGEFQSTLSMRRATYGRANSGGTGGISIHALHEESDKKFPHSWRLFANFNPRSP